jgi:protein NrfD
MRARAPYGREAKYAPPAPTPSKDGVTYYDQPQLKPSLYGWRVALYIFVAGLSGGSQMLAAAADLFGGERSRGIVRRGRTLALLAVAAGPGLLIADLHYPRRFYNMLRIFRPTAPMSIGTYVLSTFSLFSLVTAAAEYLGGNGGGWRAAARGAQLPAVLAGAGMTTYTAALLAATSTPYWAAAPRPLAAEFAGSAIASAAAALALGERAAGEAELAQWLEAVAALASAAELAAAIRADHQRRQRGLDDSNDPASAISPGSIAASAMVALPLGLYSAGLLRRRRQPILAVAMSIAVLAGSLMLRRSVLLAGNESARQSRRSLRFARREPRDPDG